MATKLTNLRTAASNNFARAYKYEIDITPSAGTLLSLGNVSSDPTTLLKTSCVSAPVPSSGNQMIEVEVGRFTLKEAGREDSPGTFSPEFILSGDYLLYFFFKGWKERVSPSDLTNGDTQGLVSTYHATVTVKGYNASGFHTITHTLHNVWCRNAPELPYADESNDIFRWSPELVYEYKTSIKPA